MDCQLSTGLDYNGQGTELQRCQGLYWSVDYTHTHSCYRLTKFHCQIMQKPLKMRKLNWDLAAGEYNIISSLKNVGNIDEIATNEKLQKHCWNSYAFVLSESLWVSRITSQRWFNTSRKGRSMYTGGNLPKVRSRNCPNDILPRPSIYQLK